MTKQQRSILIVDDNPEDQLAFQRYLERARQVQYTCYAAHTAAEGLAFCRANALDAVLLDYRLPDDDGLSFLAELVAEHGAHAFALIVLTGTGDETVAVDAMKLGAHDYLVKNTQLEFQLPVAIESAIAKTELQRQIEQQRRDLEASNAELQRALLARARSEQQLTLALQAAHMTTWEWDLGTNTVRWGQALDDVFARELPAATESLDVLFEMVPSDDRSMIREALERALREGVLPEFEFRMIRPDGRLRWMTGSGYVVRNTPTTPCRIVGITMDITQRKQADTALRRREAEFKALVENAPDIIARFDRQLRHLYVSPTVTAVTGQPQEVFIGKTNQDLGMSAESCELWDAQLLRVFETGQGGVFEFSFGTPGQLLYYQSTLIPEFDEHGAVETVMSIARDITAYKQSEERLRFLSYASQVLSSSLDVQTTLTELARLTIPDLADGCMIDLLTAQQSIDTVVIAHADPEIEGLLQEMRQLYPPKLESSHPVAQVLRSGQSQYTASIPSVTVTDNTRSTYHAKLIEQINPRSFIMVPFVVRGETIGVISLYATGTSRYYTAEDRALVEELARRAALALDNAKLYEEAQEALRERDAFLSIASHELKNPLTGLLGRAALLRRRLDRKDDTARERDDVSVILSEGQRINKLISDMLDASRLANGQLNVDLIPLDLVPLVQKVIGEFQDTTASHTFRVLQQIDTLPIAGDAGRLMQVFHNLLSNAIKYSPAGGRVTIEIGAHDGNARIAIGDEGIGIPAEALPNLFKRFYRVMHETTEQIPGSGIGLYVVKEIVTSHGGGINVSSTAGIGSTFVVQLPLQLSSALGEEAV